MAIHGISSHYGMLAVASDGEHLLIEADGSRVGHKTFPALPEVEEKNDGRPRIPIGLGPVEGPPQPMSIVASRGSERFDPHVLRLRLDVAIVDGSFSAETTRLVRDFVKSVPETRPALIDAELPSGYGIQTELLSRHVRELSRVVGRPLSMRVHFSKPQP